MTLQNDDFFDFQSAHDTPIYQALSPFQFASNPWPLGSSSADGCIRAGGGLSGATTRVITSSSESHCAALRPPLHQASRAAGLVSTFTKPEGGGALRRRISHSKMGILWWVVKSVSWAVTSMTPHTQHTHTCTLMYTHRVEYTSGYGKQWRVRFYEILCACIYGSCVFFFSKTMWSCLIV